VSRRLRSVLVKLIKLCLKVNFYRIITLWILQICQQLIRTVISLYRVIDLSTEVCLIRVNDLLGSVVVEIRVIVPIGKMASARLEYADRALCLCRVDADVARTTKVQPSNFGIDCICRATR